MPADLPSPALQSLQSPNPPPHDWHERSTQFLQKLDPPETTPVPTGGPSSHAPSPDIGISFRHGGWKADRIRVYRALSTCDAVSDRRRESFAACGAQAYVESRQVGLSLQTTEYRLTATHCHDRFCQPCAAARAATIRNNLLQHLATCRGRLKLITLTLRALDEPLKRILDRQVQHFSQLRSSKLWKKHVRGGAAILETKLGDAGRWHVHWHIVSEATFIPQKLLSEAWHELTGDSYVVDIRAVGSLAGAASYVCKYVTKAIPAAVIRSPQHLHEAILAFQGRRLVSAFGTWRGLRLSERKDDVEYSSQVTTWQCIGTLADLWQRYKSGDPEAKRILPQLWRPSTVLHAANPPPADDSDDM